MPSAQDVAHNLQMFTGIGLEVAVTELDVRLKMPATLAQLQQQATDFKSIVGACKLTEKCLGVTVWDWTDKVSCVRESGYLC